jgi:hypothetical protein
MKDCPGLDDLAMYSGDDLDAAKLAEVGEHIAQCQICGEVVEQLRSDRLRIQSLPDLPESILDEVRARVLSDIRRSSEVRRYRWPAAVAACVALLTLISFCRIPQADLPERTMSVPAKIKEQTTANVSKPAQLKPVPLKPVRAKTLQRLSRNVSQASKSTVPISDAELIAAVDRLFGDDAPAPLEGPVVITMQTQDPDVTIILLTDSTGD